MFGAISGSILLDIARNMGIYTQLELFEFEPNLTIDEEFLTSIPIVLKGFNEYGKSFSSISSIDHPSFTALRDWLATRKFIYKETGWSNGDKVLKPFSINGIHFEEGKQFYCASAMKSHLRIRNEN